MQYLALTSIVAPELLSQLAIFRDCFPPRLKVWVAFYQVIISTLNVMEGVMQCGRIQTAIDSSKLHYKTDTRLARTVKEMMSCGTGWRNRFALEFIHLGLSPRPLAWLLLTIRTNEYWCVERRVIVLWHACLTHQYHRPRSRVWVVTAWGHGRREANDQEVKRLSEIENMLTCDPFKTKKQTDENESLDEQIN